MPTGVTTSASSLPISTTATSGSVLSSSGTWTRVGSSISTYTTLTGASSGAITFTDTSSYYTHVLGPLTFKQPFSGQLEVCTCCKKEGPITLTYKPFELERKICKQCTTDMFDKMFGINNAVEKVLYESKKSEVPK